MISSIQDLSSVDNELFCWLIESVYCRISIDKKILFEGFAEDFDNSIDQDESKIVCKFLLSDGKEALYTIGKNARLEDLRSLFEQHNIDDILTDHRLFNEAMLIGNDLPLLGLFDKDIDKYISEGMISQDIAKGLTKFGTNFQKVIENLVFDKLDRQDI